jgi:hypothetical protein
MRLRVVEDELTNRVREYLAEHPYATKNEVNANIEGNRKRILSLVDQIREGGSRSLEPLGTTTLAETGSGATVSSPLKGAGTPPTNR